MTVKTLYLLRHAQAGPAPKGGQDIEKPLSPIGRNECLSLASYVKDHTINPDHILCSAAQRTKETCHYVFPQHEALPVSYLKELYYTTPNQLLHTIHQTPEEVNKLCIICHNPTLHQLSIDLAGTGDPESYRTLTREFPPGSFVTLSFKDAQHWGDIGQGSGALESFVTPYSLSQLMN